ncbi:hypothetical protein BJX63DRAFT_384615 [Aspergillus granulosus]|uniref:Uncharacterized protein n=1 Tax=Aspergillus granulosus TaxID=176169 RepID=A0ABR4HTU9_9EURO
MSPLSRSDPQSVSNFTCPRSIGRISLCSSRSSGAVNGIVNFHMPAVAPPRPQALSSSPPSTPANNLSRFHWSRPAKAQVLMLLVLTVLGNCPPPILSSRRSVGWFDKYRAA